MKSVLLFSVLLILPLATFTVLAEEQTQPHRSFSSVLPNELHIHEGVEQFIGPTYGMTRGEQTTVSILTTSDVVVLPLQKYELFTNGIASSSGSTVPLDSTDRITISNFGDNSIPRTSIFLVDEDTEIFKTIPSGNSIKYLLNGSNIVIPKSHYDQVITGNIQVVSAEDVTIVEEEESTNTSTSTTQIEEESEKPNVDIPWINWKTTYSAMDVEDPTSYKEYRHDCYKFTFSESFTRIASPQVIIAGKCFADFVESNQDNIISWSYGHDGSNHNFWVLHDGGINN